LETALAFIFSIQLKSCRILAQRRLIENMNIRAGRTTWMRVISLCCSLISVPLSCIAQTQSTAAILPGTPAMATAPSSESVDLPSAPEPNDQMAQTGGAGQSTQTDQQQPSQPNQQEQTKPGNAPSLGDLGFTPQQTQADAQMQAMLNKRTHMLKVHQTLGLITAIPMAATLITGPQAKAKGKNGQPITEPTAANLDLHIALGGLTTGMYFTTAYYSIFAPKIPGVKPKGAIRLHRDLEWIHGPGMILTPLLGIMAYKQENAGEKVHGIASYHGTAAYVTAAAYGASIVTVSWPIHWKFWGKQ
jgi:hypothetical protein